MRVVIETDKPVNPAQLAEELSARLGELPAVSTRAAGQSDGAGGILPGVVAVDGELVDEDVLRAVIDAHVPAEEPPAVDRLEAVRQATTVATLRDAVLGLYADQ